MCNNPVLEIDGERVEYDGLYRDEDCFGGIPIGSIYGADEMTRPSDCVRNYSPHGQLAFVNAYRRNPDGSYWGIQAAYRRGEWFTAENGEPGFRVWERLA